MALPPLLETPLRQLRQPGLGVIPGGAGLEDDVLQVAAGTEEGTSGDGD